MVWWFHWICGHILDQKTVIAHNLRGSALDQKNNHQTFWGYEQWLFFDPMHDRKFDETIKPSEIMSNDCCILEKRKKQKLSNILGNVLRNPKKTFSPISSAPSRKNLKRCCLSCSISSQLLTPKGYFFIEGWVLPRQIFDERNSVDKKWSYQKQKKCLVGGEKDIDRVFQSISLPERKL